ncbi:MAG: hypothetical protein M1816_005699 [Peltula sp. TS41687]|nr:MAG: hypothetical protein M1816_005699 [Peltula sp. TS41687]
MAVLSKLVDANANMGINMRCPSDKLQIKPVSNKNRAGNLHVDADDKIIGLLTKSPKGSSKGAEVAFGKKPTVRHGADESKISITTEDVRREIYRYEEEGELELILDGFVTHKIQVKESQGTGLSNDPATLLFQTQLAALNEEKKAKQTGVDWEYLAHVPPKRKGVPKNVKAPRTAVPSYDGKFRKGSEQHTPSIQTPPLAMSPKSTLNQLPASVTANMIDEKVVKMQVLRIPLLHLLAVEPVHVLTLARKLFISRAECQELLNKHGKIANDMAIHWVPTDRAYKLLDVWRFDYTRAEDREQAIYNAISAFDRLRLSRDDPLWQMLLPEHDRGKGIVLSRLNLHLPAEMRPVPTQAKLPGSSPPIAAGSGTESSPAGKSTPATKKKAVKNPKNKQTGTPTGTKKKTAGSKAQSKKNEMDNFKSAEFVHSSDDDSIEGLFKDPPAADPKMATATDTAETPVDNKRNADEVEPFPSTPSTPIDDGNKRLQSSPPSNPSAPTPTSNTTNTTNIDTPSPANSGRYSPKGFEREIVLKGIEYQTQFPLYKRLWDEVEAGDPSEEKMDELEKLHYKLKAMKEELNEGWKALGWGEAPMFV